MLFDHASSGCLALVMFILLHFELTAQNFELIKCQAAYYPMQQIEESSVNGEVGFFEWGAEVSIPQSLNDSKTILIHDLGFSQLSTRIAGDLPEGRFASRKNYQSLIYNVAWVQTLDSNWRFIVSLAPTLASDFQANLTGDDLLLQANAVTLFMRSEQLTYGFGLAYTSRLGRERILPIVVLKYKSAKFELDIGLPNRLSAMIKGPSALFSYGLLAGLNGGVFNNSTEVQTIGSMVDNVGYSRLIIGPAMSFRLKKVILVGIQGGITVGRRLEFIGLAGEIIDRTPLPAPFLGLGLSLVPQQKRKNEVRSH